MGLLLHRPHVPLLLALLSVCAWPVLSVDCPDKQSHCPEGTTCCQLDSGQWGCCPMAHAVCCEDHLHCCPGGTECDLKGQRCLDPQSGVSHPLHRKTLARPKDAPVVCPDGQSMCPAHTTCCPLDGDQQKTRRPQFWLSTGPASGQNGRQNPGQTQYGCCPVERAVCCADHVHCCPHDTQCAPEEGKCVRRSSDPSSQEAVEVPILRKQSAIRIAIPTEPAERLCGLEGSKRSRHGDGAKAGVCARDRKCCRHHGAGGSDRKLAGCCPFPDGQCCAHSAHCCPIGFACDREEDRCVSQQNGVLVSTQLFPTGRAARKHFHTVRPVVCPDGTVCGWSTGTCCARQLIGPVDGQPMTVYDCCPLAKANCCSGSRYCCPGGFKCSPGGDVGCERMSVREMIAQLFLH